jgi:putative flippase GtrA
VADQQLKKDNIQHIRRRLRTVPRRAYESKLVRYIFSGGTSTGVDMVSYYIAYNYLLKKEHLVIGNATIGAHIAALCISYSLGLITNFLITRYFVFTESTLRKREQFIRYILVAIIVFAGNYFMMKILVEVCDVWPTVARAIAAATIAFLSFRLHKVFTFKVKLPADLK